MKNLKTQGFILIDVDVVALNNAGKTNTADTDNGVATKKIQKNGKTYTYVSGQAWRYWWRNTLQKDFNWALSPIIRDKKVAFTAANPIEFADDDIFGYMKAASEEFINEEGKKSKENVTVTRLSPLKNSAVVSVTSVGVVENFSTMSRHEGPPVPYTKQEYSTIMKGMFSLDLEAVGTFASYNKTGFKNLSAKLREEAIAKPGSIEITDSHLPEAKGESHKLVRLDKAIRAQRIIDTLSALKFISGGAMQTNNMADVAPTFVILATTNSGNHPFSHVATSKGAMDHIFELNVDGIEEIIRDFKAQIQGKVFIGHRSGFLGSDDVQKLEVLKSQYPDVVELGSINESIDKYVAQVKSQIP
jgi:CRISPR-associated protein Cst2